MSYAQRWSTRIRTLLVSDKHTIARPFIHGKPKSNPVSVQQALLLRSGDWLRKRYAVTVPGRLSVIIIVGAVTLINKDDSTIAAQANQVD
jgi:hypothetical protein